MIATVFHQSYVTQGQSLLTLLNFLVILFSFILVSTGNGLLFCMVAFCIILF